MQKVGEAVGVGGIGTGSPDVSNRPTQIGVEREQACAGRSPYAGPFVTPFLFLARPPVGAANHFLIDALLAGGYGVGETRQGFPLAALLGEEGRGLEPRPLIDRGPGPFAEGPHTPT